MKRIFSLVLIFTLLLSLLPFQTFAQENGQAKVYFELDPSVENLEKGTIFPVHLKVSNAVDLFGIQTAFTFDQNILTLVTSNGAPTLEAEIGDFFTEEIADVEVVENKITSIDEDSQASLALSYLGEPKNTLKSEGILATYYFVWESEDENVFETELSIDAQKTKLIDSNVEELPGIATEDFLVSIPQEVLGSVGFEINSTYVSGNQNERLVKLTLVNVNDPSIRYSQTVTINSQVNFAEIQLGKYQLQATSTYYKPFFFNQILVTEELPNVELGGITLESLRKLAVVSGKVIDEDLVQELQGVTVTISSLKGNHWQQGTTDSNGVFSFTVPYAEKGSEYSLSFWKDGFTPVEKDIFVTADLDLSIEPIQMSDGNTLSGTVKFPEGGLTPSVTVSAIGDNGQFSHTNTSSDGTFTITGLSDGIYTIIVTDPTQNYLYHEVTGVNVVGDFALSEDIVLVKAAQVQGLVTDSSGTPVKNAFLWLYNYDLNVYGSAVTNQNGMYSIKGLNVTETTEATVDAYKNGFTTTSDSVDLDQGVTTTLDLRLLKKGEVVSTFKGETNFLKANKKIASPGELLTYQIQYQHNGNSNLVAKDAEVEITLPELTLINVSSIKVYQNGQLFPHALDGRTVKVSVGDVAFGNKGNVTVMFDVGNNVNIDRSLVASSKMHFTLNNQQVNESLGTTTTSLLFTTFNAPTVTTTGEIVVFGEANPNTTVYIYSTSSTGSRLLGKAKTDGKYWSKKITLTNDSPGLVQEHKLFVRAEYTNGSEIKLSNPSKEIAVLFDSTLPTINKITLNAGWNKNVKINPTIGIPSLAITEFSPIRLDMEFLPEGLEKMSEVKISFLGEEVVLDTIEQNMTAIIPGNWTGQGEEPIYLHYSYQNGDKVTEVNLPIAQVIILIDPSGIVTDAATKQPIEGIQATAEVWDVELGQYVFWNAELYGQVNPQLTDATGYYGWVVPEGTYRVVFESLDGTYENTIADDNGAGIVIPPPRTDVDVELKRKTKGKISEVTPIGDEVEQSSVVTVAFDRWMNKDTFIESNFVMKSSNGTVLDGNFSFEKDMNAPDAAFLTSNDKAFNVLTFDPARSLSSEETYTVNVNSNVTKDFYGLSLDAGKVWTFKVKKDTQSPTIPGGGNVIVQPSADYEVINQELFVVTTKKDAKTPEGRDKVIITFDVEVFKQSIKDITEEYHTIVFKSDATINAQELVLSGEIVSSIKALDKNMKIKLETPISSYSIPVEALGLERYYKQLSANDLEELVVSINLEKFNASKVNGPNVTTITNDVDFNVLVKNGAKEVKISTFNGFTELEMNIEETFYKTKATAVRVKDNGTFSAVPTYFSSSTATIYTNSTGKYVVVKHSKTFDDIKGTWNEATVEKLASKFIVNGTSATTFSPAQPVTRGQLTVLLTRSLGLQASADYNGHFVDVKGSEWFVPELMGAVEAGIIGGFSDQTFRPNQVVTRQEASAMIARALEFVGYQSDSTMNSVKMDTKYQDYGQISNWAKDSVQVVVDTGIIVGVSDNTFDPAGETRRDQMATILDRLLTLIKFSN